MPGTEGFEKLVAGTAVVAGTAAASCRTGRSDKLGSAFKAKGRNFLAHFPAFTFRTLDRRFAKYDPFEIFLAIFTMIFEDWHNSLLKNIITTPKGENKGIKSVDAHVVRREGENEQRKAHSPKRSALCGYS
jgi:hypothetical protein